MHPAGKSGRLRVLKYNAGVFIGVVGVGILIVGDFFNMEIAGFGVFGTPAVVVDGEVKSVGKIPTKQDVEAWLK